MKYTGFKVFVLKLCDLRQVMAINESLNKILMWDNFTNVLLLSFSWNLIFIHN